MNIATTRSPGLRKFIPQPDRYAERYGNFTLTRCDLDILDVVHRYRYLEARHIRALVGGSDQQITRRLQGLFHDGYLGRYARRERMRLELGPGAPLIAYGLALKGVRALERQRAAATATTRATPEQVRWRREYTRRTEWFLEHHLMVSNFRCVLELALREMAETELVRWDQGMDTWFRVSIPGKSSRVMRIAPDAHFTLRRGSDVQHFFLEADRATEEQHRLVDKFVGYWWHLQSRQLAGTGAGRPRANVLFVTTGENRMFNMIESLKQLPKPNRADHGGKGSFRFCLDRDVNLENPPSILGPVWHTTASYLVGERLPFPVHQVRL